MVSVEYLAGFIDGEGSLALARRRHRGGSPEYSLRVCVYNSHRELLSEIQQTWGGVMSAVGQRRPGWKPAYALIWTNATAARLLQGVAPCLRVKARQAAALLEFQERLWKYRRFRDSRGRLLSLSKQELEIREAFHDRLRHLNMKGTRRSSRHGGRERRPEPRMAVSAEYLAGFVDGEGSLMIRKWKYWRYPRPLYKPRISIANTDRAVLEDIQQHYGGILVNQPPRKARWSFAYQLVWTEGMVERILRSVMPHLRIKREQARVLSKLIRHRQRTRQGRRGPNGRFFAPLPSDVIAFRERLWRRVRELNARGAFPHRRPVARGK